MKETIKELKKLVEELDRELGELEATYDVEDEEYKKLIMQDIISINRKLDKLGNGKYKSDYPIKELKKLVSLFEHRKLFTNDSILMAGDLKKLINLTNKL